MTSKSWAQRCRAQNSLLHSWWDKYWLRRSFRALLLHFSIWSFNSKLAKCSSRRSFWWDETWQERKAARSSDRFILFSIQMDDQAPDWDHNSITAIKCDLPLLCDDAFILRCVFVTITHQHGPTLHHENDIRVKWRIEEVHESLRAELSCPGAWRVPVALHVQTQRGEVKRNIKRVFKPLCCVSVSRYRHNCHSVSRSHPL